MKKSSKSALIALTITTVTIIVLASCCTTIDSASVGIRFKKWSSNENLKGGVEGTCRGWVWYNPITERIFEYPTFIQRVTYEPFTVNPKDAAIFSMTPTLAYQIDEAKATDIFIKYRKPVRELEMGYIKVYVGIDIGAKDEIYNFIESLAQKGVAVLLVSSDVSEVLRVAHRIIVSGLYGRSAKGDDIMWDTIGRKYYKEREPKFEKIGGLDILKSTKGKYELRYARGMQSFLFDKEEVLFNRYIAIIRDILILKCDGFRIYKIYGYEDNNVLVRTKKGNGSIQVSWNGHFGRYYDSIPKGFSFSPSFSGLQLSRAK